MPKDETIEPEATPASAPTPAAPAAVLCRHPEDWAVLKGLLVLNARGLIDYRRVTPWRFCCARIALSWPGKTFDPECPQRIVDPFFAISESDFDAAITAVV